MADFTADFEAGVNGNNVTTGAGEASATAWDTITGTAPTYSNTHVAHGALACQVSAQVTMQWNTTITDSYGRFYIYGTANQGVITGIMRASGAKNICINTTGTVRIESNTGQQLFTTATVLNNQWNRIEWRIVNSTTVGVFELKLFNSADSTTATETLTSPSSWNMGASDTDFQFGSWNRAPDTPIWLDDIVANATAYPGPAVTPSVENLAPVIYGRGAC